MVEFRLMATHTPSIPPYPQEALLIEAIPEMAGDRLLCTSPGLAQFAGTAAQTFPTAVVSCTYLDLYRANLAKDHWHDLPRNLQINCAADFPDERSRHCCVPVFRERRSGADA